MEVRGKTKRRLGLLLGVLSYVYFEAVKARLDSLSRVLALLISVVTHRIRVCKPKSKRMQYLVLLGVAFAAKHLTRLDEFPDDLDHAT